jgi:hypothetical protein
MRLMTDPRLSDRLACAGERHVARRFSMRAMCTRYRTLLAT